MSLIEMSVPHLYTKNGYTCYTSSTSLNNEGDSANTKTRLHERYFSMIVTVCCRTNKRGKFSRSPSNITNIQILSTWKPFPMHSPDFWNLNLTQLPQSGFSLHQILVP